MKEVRPMRMSDFVVRGAVIAELRAATKEGVIREMVAALRDAGRRELAEPEDVVQALLRREMVASTGVGRGVAIPHAKHACVSQPIAAVAVSRQGVAFDSLDGKPVDLFVLLLSPHDQAGLHLRVLEHISRRLRDDGFARALRQAPTGEAIWGLLDQAEGEKRS
jgi:PTS system fructose-specific IIA component/PTS system nitrogen regulatory IIA component